MGGPNRFFLNRGGTDLEDWRFEEMAGKVGVHEPFFSFPVWFWDFDNDGWLDLCVGNSDLRRLDDAAADMAREFMGLSLQSEMPRIYRNNGVNAEGVPSYTDVTDRVNMDKVLYAMGGNFGDLDNDGFEDAYFGTGAPDFRSLIPNRMFLNQQGEAFREVTLEGGFGHLQKGHGIAFGDLDRDGDQDVYAVMGGAYEGDVFQDALFENPGDSTNGAWIVLHLEGQTANRSAIGARLHLIVSGSDGVSRSIHRVVSTGGSFGSSSLDAEIGLGDAIRFDELRIVWPDKAQTVEVYTDLEMRGHYRIVQGKDPEKLEREPVPLGQGRNQQHVHGM